MLAQGVVLLGVHHDLHLALIHNGFELALDLGVEDFADVRNRKPASKSALEIRWPVCITPFDAVQEGVDLALHNGLEVGLHVLARDLDDVGQGDLGADGDLVKLGAVDRDLVDPRSRRRLSW